MSKSPKLSNVQNERMGGLIAVLCHREPYPWLCDKLKVGAFIELKNEKYCLTDKGYKELERLMTLCGLAMFYRNGVPEIQATNAR
jgi:hypothetical protein